MALYILEMKNRKYIFTKRIICTPILHFREMKYWPLDDYKVNNSAHLHITRNLLLVQNPLIHKNIVSIPTLARIRHKDTNRDKMRRDAPYAVGYVTLVLQIFEVIVSLVH